MCAIGDKFFDDLIYCFDCYCFTYVFVKD